MSEKIEILSEEVHVLDEAGICTAKECHCDADVYVGADGKLFISHT